MLSPSFFKPILISFQSSFGHSTEKNKEKMAAVSTVSMLDSNLDVDKLTYEIFSILENKFLFGYDQPKHTLSHKHSIPYEAMKSTKNITGKVRILSIDGGSATGGLLAARSLAHLEATLRLKSGNPNARIADYFDVVAGSGAGGILAALLFTRGRDGGPMFTADQALRFITENRRGISKSSTAGVLRRLFRPARSDDVLSKVFGETTTLKDTLKSVLVPCYDLTTSAPFLFSRADALEIDGYDFKMRDVCLATLADQAVEMRSVDRRTKIAAVGGGVAMNNPTAAAITHVLNNKQEFPFCNGVEDLLVLSLGNGESDVGAGDLKSPMTLLKIAGDGASDMVDQAVSMAFGPSRTNNYVRIQVNNTIAKRNGTQEKMAKLKNSGDIFTIADEMLAQKNAESVLFQGKKLIENTNAEKLEMFGEDLIKEHQRRKTCILPTVVLKQASSSSPRTSSATTLSTLSSN